MKDLAVPIKFRCKSLQVIEMKRVIRGWTLLAVMLGGCSTTSAGEFERYVGQKDLRGLTVVQAEAVFAKDGFLCHDYSGYIDCTRREEGFLVTCLQRVVLKPAAPNAALLSAEAKSPACFGGFG